MTVLSWMLIFAMAATMGAGGAMPAGGILSGKAVPSAKAERQPQNTMAKDNMTDKKRFSIRINLLSRSFRNLMDLRTVSLCAGTLNKPKTKNSGLFRFSAS